jgi:NhaP-type Na+/H+ or K+/H+ antiporter
MGALEQLLVLFTAAVILAAAARRVAAPYPVFLALGGAVLALLPVGPSFALPPELALALFVAPVLLDAAYDASLRDLRDNWAPVTGLVVFAVSITTVAVAVVVRGLVPEMPWAPAIALGAIVAPPDAVAATAVLRQLRPPHRILTVLEGESLLNDASALLIYRLAVGAVAANGFSAAAVAPAFLLAIAGSVIVGPALGWLALKLLTRIEHIPTAIIVQFVTTFGVWLLAEHLGLSAVLTMVCYAVTVARTAPERTPARLRIPTYAVWETVVFALNVLAFIFIGLQIRPILDGLAASERGQHFGVAAAVVVTVIVVRMAWHMSFNAVVRWRLPYAFPYRDLIVLTAFFVVLATLVIQGLTIGPLLRALDLQDGDPVAREVHAARERALRAGLASLDDAKSAPADAVRLELRSHLAHEHVVQDVTSVQSLHRELHRRALDAARQAVLAMRSTDEIGDDAFHQIEEELDWIEMAGNGKES